MCRKPFNPLQLSRSKSKPQAVPTLHRKLSIGRKQRKNSTKKKNYSTPRKISPPGQPTIGKISIGPGNRDTSIAFTLDMNGTSTTKPIMSKWAIEIILYSTMAHRLDSTDNPPPKVVQGYKVCIYPMFAPLFPSLHK